MHRRWRLRRRHVGAEERLGAGGARSRSSSVGAMAAALARRLCSCGQPSDAAAPPPNRDEGECAHWSRARGWRGAHSPAPSSGTKEASRRSGACESPSWRTGEVRGSAPTTTSGAVGGYPISTHRPREEAQPEGMERWSTRDHRSGLDLGRSGRRREIRRRRRWRRCEVRGRFCVFTRCVWLWLFFYSCVRGRVGARCVTASDASGRPCWSITVFSCTRYTTGGFFLPNSNLCHIRMCHLPVHAWASDSDPSAGEILAKWSGARETQTDGSG
jgi:hypothetical protein